MTIAFRWFLSTQNLYHKERRNRTENVLPESCPHYIQKLQQQEYTNTHKYNNYYMILTKYRTNLWQTHSFTFLSKRKHIKNANKYLICCIGFVISRVIRNTINPSTNTYETAIPAAEYARDYPTYTIIRKKGSRIPINIILVHSFIFLIVFKREFHQHPHLHLVFLTQGTSIQIFFSIKDLNEDRLRKRTNAFPKSSFSGIATTEIHHKVPFESWPVYRNLDNDWCSTIFEYPWYFVNSQK